MTDEGSSGSSDGQRFDEAEIKFALQDVTWRLRQFTGNVLRVIAGAGEPYHLGQQAFELGQAIKDLPEGTLVGQLTEALEESVSGGLETSEYASDLDDAATDIQQASLRIVAARLLGQRVQVTRRENDFFQALRRLDDVREKNRREAASATRLPRSTKERAEIASQLAATFDTVRPKGRNSSGHKAGKSRKAAYRAPPPADTSSGRDKNAQAQEQSPADLQQPAAQSTVEFMRRRRDELGRNG